MNFANKLIEEVRKDQLKLTSTFENLLKGNVQRGTYCVAKYGVYMLMQIAHSNVIARLEERLDPEAISAVDAQISGARDILIKAAAEYDALVKERKHVSPQANDYQN